MPTPDITKIKQRYGIVGNDPKLNLAIENAVKSAPTNLSVLVTGESGVGKDIFARLIHENSERHQKRLVAVNCGAIPEGTIESELFGHVKGSFTGADRDRKGYFKEADAGTIFLDEVGELPLAIQVKLLRVLQNGEIIPVGESKPQKVDVRVVAATNTDVELAVREGRFRPDLYYRLNQMSISIPPLRERQQDIPMLFARFAADIATESHTPAITLADDEARNYLMHYPWYGNVRELQTITQRIAWLETERRITRSILENYIPSAPAQNLPVPVQTASTSGYSASITDRELLLKALSMGQIISQMRDELYDLRQTVEQLKQSSSFSPTITTPPPTHIITHPSETYLPHHTEPTPIDDEEEYISATEINDTPTEQEMPLSLNERERQAIEMALAKHKGNRKLAAQALGISERTLYRRIKNLDL